MKFKRSFMTKIARVSLVAFVNFILIFYYPSGVQAGENLSISGFEIKRPVFKPYLNELPVNYRLGNREITAFSGEFSFFLNKAALVNAEIQDMEFNLVKSLELMKEGKEGGNFILWWGGDEKGEFVKSGRYILSITAMAEDGTSAIISKELEIEFDALKGTKFEQRIWRIEGKPKKVLFSYSNPPEKTIWGEFVEMESNIWNTLCDWGDERGKEVKDDSAAIGVLLGIVLSIIVVPFTCLYSPFRSTPDTDYERRVKLNQEIDEYNAELEAEIAEENKEIDEHNFKIKDAIVVRMKVLD